MATPVPADVRDLLEQYNIDDTVLSDEWLENRRDKFIIPWAEKRTRQSLTEESQVTEYKSGTGSSILILDRKPIVSLDEIELVQGGGGDWNIDVTSIEVVKREGILKATANMLSSGTYLTPLFPRGKYNIKVVYTYGFSSMPDDVAEAITYLMAEVALTQVANRTGGGALTVQGYSRNYGERGRYDNIRSELAAWAMSLLSPYFVGTVG